MPPSRSAAPGQRVVVLITCVLTTWSLCTCAPAGEVRTDVGGTTTEDDGLYRPPAPGEDGAYHPEAEEEQTLEENTGQEEDGAYSPEKFETPSPPQEQDGERFWTESTASSNSGNTMDPGNGEASDDGSYRPEHHQAEMYDERADSGLNAVTSPVEPTEASDDGSYRPHEYTETPTEDYDEKADNGTDWRTNDIEHQDEGQEASDDGLYRPHEHGPRSRREAVEDTEEVQLAPVMYYVGGAAKRRDEDAARETPPADVEQAHGDTGKP